jgi:predicted aspartyl protease
MPLRFRYRFYTSPAPAPIWSLGGRLGWPRPVAPVTAIGPTGAVTRDALLDTGADDTVFPEGVAAVIGLDLTNAPTGGASGVGMVGAVIRFAEVTLRLSDGVEVREWPARVGFATAPLKRPLLGFAGFFQFFTATFDGAGEQVELAANALYPGT